LIKDLPDVVGIMSQLTLNCFQHSLPFISDINNFY
jgi:hypothetical protein